MALMATLQLFPSPKEKALTSRSSPDRTRRQHHTQISTDRKGLSPCTISTDCSALSRPRISSSVLQVMPYLVYFLSAEILLSAEPMASIKPKFGNSDAGRIVVFGSNDPVTILCPAQGFPLPSFRWDPQNFFWSEYWVRVVLLFALVRACWKYQTEIPYFWQQPWFWNLLSWGRDSALPCSRLPCA